MKNLLFYFGEDPGGVLDSTRQVTAAFKEKHGAENLETFRGDEIDDFAALEEALSSLGLFATHRLVVLRDPWQTRKSAWRAELAEFLKEGKLAETTTLLLAEAGAPDRREKLFKIAAKEAGGKKEFDAVTPALLTKRAQEKIAAAGEKISPAAARELAARLGKDSLRLEPEIGKLLLLAGGEEISLELVKAAVAPADPEQNIFALTDALGKRDARRALVELENLLAAGEPEPKILATVTTHFRRLLILAAGEKEEGLNPFVARKLGEQARFWKKEELRDFFSKLVELDAALKGGKDRAGLSSLELRRMIYKETS